MYKTKRIVLTTVCIFSCFFSAGQTLHGIIVANTNDPNIGISCEKDQIAISVELNAIANAIGYKTNMIIINRNDFIFENVDKAISDFSCKPEDIVFFHYSGHGMNVVENESRWPVLLLETGKYPLDVIHSKLKRKGAAFVVTLADCCNNVITIEDIEFRGYKQIVPDAVNKEIVYKHLFLQPRGDIIISGSQPGQYSYGTSNKGGFFTHKFIESLHTALNYSASPSWNNLLDDSKNRVAQLNFSRKQEPQYEINLERPLTTEEAHSDAEQPQSGHQKISYPEINAYLNQLVAERGDKKKLRNRYTQYFTPKSRVDIYVNKTLTDIQPVEHFLDRLSLHHEKIKNINLIETKSEYNPDENRYQKITVQEIWLP